MQAIQDICYPEGVCYGCGPANPDGMQIKSYWSDDGQYVVASIMPAEKYTGYTGWVYGGMIASLVDCHSNWTAMAFGYRAEGRALGTLPRITCVTGTLGVKYLKPTPMGVMLHLRAWVEGEVGRKNHVMCEVRAGDVLTVVGDSVFIRVDSDTFN